MGGIGRAQLILAGGALFLGAAVARVGLDDVAQRSSAGEVALTLAVGWSFAGSGLVAWRLRPDNPIGPVMVATGLFRLVAELDAAEDPLLFSIGRALQPWSFVGIAYILLAFPEGRLISALQRVLTGVMLAGALVLTVPYPALGGYHGPCADCPDNVFEIADVPAVATPLHDVTLLAGAVVAVTSFGVLARRWRRASPRLRFAIAPVLWVGAVAFLALGVWLVEMAMPSSRSRASEVLLGVVFALVPIAFLVGVGRTRLARSAVADLVIELGNTTSPGRLRDALAHALRDPGLEIAYWLPDTERYVDAFGQVVTLPDHTAEHAVTMVEHRDRRVAALIHDPALLDDHHLVESVCAAAGLALENGRLQAELQARLADLSASRTRIVEAEEAERRRIERDLHDGTQQRLVSLAMTLGLAESRVTDDPGGTQTLLREARTGLADTLNELRELSQGIHPSILTERGLRGAAEELASRARMPVHLDVTLARRLPGHVEAVAYYVVSEALSNIAKHARATAVNVAVAESDGGLRVEVTDNGAGGADETRGSGLRGLRDRVEAVGGQLSVHSPAGCGTTLRAEIPCES